jgi:FtsP/CotA-like multicopper oxidase with cupredoxin domain
MTGRITRRQLLGYGVGTVAAGGLSAVLGTVSSSSSSAASRPQATEAFPQPRIQKSANKELSVNLVARPAVVDMGVGHPVTTYTYGGNVPGYTWELDPGDRLKVHLVNELPKLPTAPMRMDRPHEWTTTNLHTHGLHVSPSGTSDNIFLSIPPGQSQDYVIDIPSDHPGGIFWYHPHRHGAVTQQVRAGMAGMIVVRGAIDQVPEVAAATEKIMVMQSIELGDDFQLLDPIPDPSKTEAFFPRKKVLYTVNGVVKPTVTMRPGEVQRWRILNAAEGKFLSLTLMDKQQNRPVPLHVLAWDGLTLAAPQATNVVMLSAGNRVEALVQVDEPGSYELVLTPGSSQKPKIPGMPDVEYPSMTTPAPKPTTPANTAANMPGMNMPAQDMPAKNGPTPEQRTMEALATIPGELEVRPIATMVVTGAPMTMALPAALPAWDPPMPPISKSRQLAYSVQREGLEFLSFGVNGVPFQPDRPPYQATLGTAEEWTLVNDLDPKLMDHAHVFHIHVNPFKITKINGHLLETPLWRDTFVLTRTDHDSITFVSHFADFAGKFVNHCHVVAHEDLGMMEAVEVVR